MASVSEEKWEEDIPIVVVGGGICGLATALALHRKGLKSVVLERSNTMRASGAAIGILANGWRALDQLGLAASLRQLASPLQGGRDVWIDKGKQERFQFFEGEARCLKRSDLIQALADALPPGTIRFGCEIVSVQLDPQLTRPSIHLLDGKSIQAKVLIGCDGSKSIVGDYLGLKATKLFGLCAVRGLTNYPNGHQFAHEFLRLRRNGILFARIPIDHNKVYWFVAQPTTRLGANFPEDAELIKQLTLDTIFDFPSDMVEMVEKSDRDSISLTHLRYRAPWDLLFESFCKGPITVAGDAMHVMGPFLGQGGSSGIEDAVVLARNLANRLIRKDVSEGETRDMVENVVKAFQEFVKERRMRVVRLSTQAFLTGFLLLESTSSMMKFLVLILMVVLFRDLSGHTKYDCGQL